MHVVHWYPNFLAGGGVANSVQALATAQARAGASIWIASLSNDAPIYGALTPVNGVRIATWDGTRQVGRGTVRLHLLDRASSRALADLHPDVVHVHAEFNPDNWWAPRLWKCPLVLTPHGAYHPSVMARGTRWKRGYIAVARRLLYRHVSRFHGLSPAEQRDISAALPKARTFYVPQGPSPAVQNAMCHQRDHQTDVGPISFMFIGRIDVRTKGLDVLVEAFGRAVLARAEPASLTLVGPDWHNGIASLRRLADQLGVGALVHIRDRVAHEDVPTLLQSCDVYVQLSRNESSPLSLNDALVLGKPVIVSDRVGTVSCEEIVRMPHVKVVSPCVSEAASAIAGALDNLHGLRRAALSARSELRDFLSWGRAARQHLDEYESLLVEKD